MNHTPDEMRRAWAEAQTVTMLQDLLQPIRRALEMGASGPTYIVGQLEDREVTVVVLPTREGLAQKVAELVRAELAPKG